MSIRALFFLPSALALCTALAGGAYVLDIGDAVPVPAVGLSAAPHAAQVDAADPRARLEANIALLDARYAAEPIDREWAANEEQRLGAFFSAQAPDARGLVAPVSVETSCHSATCRISARYADPLAAEMAMQRLGLHVAPRLPYAAVLPRALDDGSIQIEAWYSANRTTL